MHRLQAVNNDGVRPSFSVGRRKHTLVKFRDQSGPWYVQFSVNDKQFCRSTGTDDASTAVEIAQEIIRSKRASMAKALTQPAANDSDARGLPEGFEVFDQWYRLQRRKNRPSWFIRFYGLNGRALTYSTGQTELELAKARAAGFIEGYFKGLVSSEEGAK